MTTIQQILDFAILYLDTMLASNNINQSTYDIVKNIISNRNLLDDFLERIQKHQWNIERCEKAIKKLLNLEIDKYKDLELKPYESKPITKYHYIIVGAAIITLISYKVITKLLYN